MKKGDLVKIKGERRFYVALPVTQRDIAKGMNAKRPGFYLFGGFWYGGQVLSNKGYGKIIEPQGRVVGRIRGRIAALKRCR